jgi:hypothetical protein
MKIVVELYLDKTASSLFDRDPEYAIAQTFKRLGSEFGQGDLEVLKRMKKGLDLADHQGIIIGKMRVTRG